MRELKFRMFDGSNMIPVGDIAFFADGGYHINNEFPLPSEQYKLMQFTGLKDKNGTDIYEGDIIRNKWKSAKNFEIGSIHEVKFGKHMTSLDYYASQAYGWYVNEIGGDNEEHTLHNLPSDNGIEVVGNIYQNPELIK